MLNENAKLLLLSEVFVCDHLLCQPCGPLFQQGWLWHDPDTLELMDGGRGSGGPGRSPPGLPPVAWTSMSPLSPTQQSTPPGAGPPCPLSLISAPVRSFRLAGVLFISSFQVFALAAFQVGRQQPSKGPVWKASTEGSWYHLLFLVTFFRSSLLGR